MAKRRKILAISHYSFVHNRAGGERMLLNILKHLAQNNKVDWIAFDNEGKDSVIDKVRIRHGKHLKDNIDFSKYDVVISHFGYSTFSYEQAKQFNKPFIILMHNDDESGDYHKTIPNADLTIFNTKWIKESWESKKVFAKRSVIVHPPVDHNKHLVEHTGDNVTLINTTIQKGGILLYNLSKIMPSVNFLAVKGGYGVQQTSLLNNRPNVKVIDNVDDMKEVWSKTKILIMPSTYESYGLAAVEATVSGIPVVYHETPGLKEALGEAGVGINNFSLIRWKNEILKLIRDDTYYNEVSLKSKEQSKAVDSEEELDKLSEIILSL